MSLEESISYIDSLIQQIIQDMFNFRQKRLEASKKVLEQLKTLMDTTNLIYRLGELYDRVVKVEHPLSGLSDISRPRLKIQYTGDKMPIWVDYEAILLPEVPPFEYEYKEEGKAELKMSIETLRDNVLIRFPISANVSETPDIEDETGKYYYFNFSTITEAEDVWTIYAGKRIAISGLALEVSEIRTWKSYNFIRLLTIGGTQYNFQFSLRVGKIIGYYYIASPNYIDNCEFPCTMFSFFTNYPDEVSYLIFGQDFPKGKLSNDLYSLDVLGVLMNGRYVLYNLVT